MLPVLVAFLGTMFTRTQHKLVRLWREKWKALKIKCKHLSSVCDRNSIDAARHDEDGCIIALQSTAAALIWISNVVFSHQYQLTAGFGRRVHKNTFTVYFEPEQVSGAVSNSPHPLINSNENRYRKKCPKSDREGFSQAQFFFFLAAENINSR